jgi:hypothetical protein
MGEVQPGQRQLQHPLTDDQGDNVLGVEEVRHQAAPLLERGMSVDEASDTIGILPEDLWITLGLPPQEPSGSRSWTLHFEQTPCGNTAEIRTLR